GAAPSRSSSCSISRSAATLTLDLDFADLQRSDVRHLDEAHVRTLQVGEVQVQRLHLVDGEAEAQVSQLGHVAGLDGAARVEGGLTQFEDQGVLQVAVLVQEVEE